MNIGQIIILIAFFASLAATVFYFMNGMRKKPLTQILAERSYDVSVSAGVVASVALLYFLLTSQFQYSYVTRFSSFHQPFIYLVSAFWAGQEGTFLLWALLVGLMGVVLRKTTRREDHIAMGVVSAFGAFLYLLLIVKSPFESVSPVPQDGQGMNPLLMNLWMAIHPPILFVGYAATLFPFALVFSALARRKFEIWNEQGFAWTLFASVMLGAGIIIGGFWAYETLGWGGYWGWDPVENSSLVPWMTLLALVHGLLIFKSKGALARTNIFLAMLAFLLVLYATFLTRSGVLADFSVHSFADLGISNYLIGIMVLAVVSGWGLFVTRFRSIQSSKLNLSGINRELMVFLSIFVLMAGAAFTFSGMSSPIITGLFGKASQVDTSFYNTVNLPVAIAMAILLGITPFLSWTEEKRSLVKRYSMPLILTALACIIAYVGGVTSAVLLVFVGSASFALISNTIIAFRQYRSGWLTLGGPITHIGTALLLIGIIGSGKFDETKQIVLQQGQPQDVFGYKLVFNKMIETPDQKPVVDIDVFDGQNKLSAAPRLYFSQYSQAMMREPAIKIFPLKDLYLSPLDVKTPQPEQAENGLVLTKGETKHFHGYDIQFVQFETGDHSQQGATSVGAVLNVTSGGVQHVVKPVFSIDGMGQQSFLPAELPPLQTSLTTATKPVVILSSMDVETKSVQLEFRGVADDAPKQAGLSELTLEVSIKPLMMVVWTGVLLIIGGSAIAFARRTGKNNAFTAM